MAQAFPASRFVGIDYHAESIATARERAAEAGVADRVTFEIAGAGEIPGSGYDLVAFFDAFHDLGDPLAAARSAASVLAPDGRCMLVEPYAGDRVQDNLHPVGRFYYAMSTLVCTPGSLSQPGRAALGTQAGEARLAEVLQRGRLRRGPARGGDAAEPRAGGAAWANTEPAWACTGDGRERPLPPCKPEPSPPPRAAAIDAVGACPRAVSARRRTWPPRRRGRPAARPARRARTPARRAPAPRPTPTARRGAARRA